MRALLVVNPKATTTSDYNRDLLIREYKALRERQARTTTKTPSKRPKRAAR